MAKTPEQIHFVSRYNDREERGYKDLGNGTFSTEAWTVSEAAAHSVKQIWLHNRKDDTAWDGGQVVGPPEAVQVTDRRTPKWRFTVRRAGVGDVRWPAAVGGGPEKAYV